jgi:hypothetical protein
MTQLAVVGETILDEELVNVSLNGFSKAWEPFIMVICSTDKLPKWERLWDDCIQKETHRESISGKQGGGAADENLSLVSKTKKGKGKVFKKVDSQGEGQQSGQKRDMSKIKCYIFHKNDHFASQCPQRKKGKGKSQIVAATSRDTVERTCIQVQRMIVHLCLVFPPALLPRCMVLGQWRIPPHDRG